MQEVRITIADFMEDNEALHQLPAFQVQKNNTLQDKKLTWSVYLQELRHPQILRDYVGDELVLLCASLMFGKEIVVVTTDKKGAPTSYVAAGKINEWPTPYSTPPLTLGYLQNLHYEPLHRRPLQSDAFTTECKGCGKSGKYVRSHLANIRKAPCKSFYSEAELRNLEKRAF